MLLPAAHQSSLLALLLLCIVHSAHPRPQTLSPASRVIDDDSSATNPDGSSLILTTTNDNSTTTAAAITGDPPSVCPLRELPTTCYPPHPMPARARVNRAICFPVLAKISDLGLAPRDWRAGELGFNWEWKDDRSRCIIVLNSALRREGRFGAGALLNALDLIFDRCDRRARGGGYGGAKGIVVGGEEQEGWWVRVQGPTLNDVENNEDLEEESVEGWKEACEKGLEAI